MVFQVEQVALELIAVLRPLRERIKASDRALADQLSRAATSVVLNIGEGNYSDPGNRRARFFTAAGSANETRLALLNSVGWGICSDADVEAALSLTKRVLAMLWRLTHN
jgi:four helix bundle protein